MINGQKQKMNKQRYDVKKKKNQFIVQNNNFFQFPNKKNNQYYNLEQTMQ